MLMSTIKHDDYFETRELDRKIIPFLSFSLQFHFVKFLPITKCCLWCVQAIHCFHCFSYIKFLLLLPLWHDDFFTFNCLNTFSICPFPSLTISGHLQSRINVLTSLYNIFGSAMSERLAHVRKVRWTFFYFFTITHFAEHFVGRNNVVAAIHVSATRPTNVEQQRWTSNRPSQNVIQQMLHENVGTFSRASNTDIQ